MHQYLLLRCVVGPSATEPAVCDAGQSEDTAVWHPAADVHREEPWSQQVWAEAPR